MTRDEVGEGSRVGVLGSYGRIGSRGGLRLGLCFVYSCGRLGCWG